VSSVRTLTGASVTGHGLRCLDDSKLKWRLPDDPVADQVLIPALRSAEAFDCMVGYFGGQALRQLAPGLAAFIAGGNQPMRLLVSPLLSDEDLAGVELGLTTAEEVLADAVGASLSDAVALEDALAHHTLHCLAYLLSAGRLQMRVVLVDDGIFHVKEWIFRSAEDIAVLSGSANFTGRAISKNVESLHLHRSWRDLDNLDTCTESVAEFELLWTNRKRNSRTVDLPTALADDLIRTYGADVPTEQDYERAVSTTTNEAEAGTPTVFAIPGYLQIDEGPYAHQGLAVRAWEAAGRQGILAMATGAGKTISALVSARRLLDETSPLAIVVAVPTRPLVTQWAEECVEFGLRPIIAPSLQRQKRLKSIQLALDNLTFGVSDVETIIVTNEGLVDPEFSRLLEGYGGAAILIADEVHNLGGVTEFIGNPPTWPTAKLGLSATPVRQYDDEGTAALLEYFGDVVFEFSLDDAIGVCLVPYDYFVHRVDLTEPERERYAELTERIRRRMAIVGNASGDDLQLTILLNQRRLILETAEGKLGVLADLIDKKGAAAVRRTLFYATDKDPAQMVAVNELLRDRRIRAHQITEAETSRGRLLAATMKAFSDGVLQALTAKRVLDEGLNVPQIDTAYILASTTVRKQWVQRRGRVLRPSPRTGKTHAVIHDFLVVPPSTGGTDDDERRLVQSELERADEFARLARNRASATGPLSVLNEIRYEFLV
jgi:superfamily II DNA or RNA helicase